MAAQTTSSLPPVVSTASRGEWATAFVMWLAYAFASVGPWLALQRERGVESESWQALAGWILDSLVWILLTPAIFAALDRLPLTRGLRIRNGILRILVGSSRRSCTSRSPSR